MEQSRFSYPEHMEEVEGEHLIAAIEATQGYACLCICLCIAPFILLFIYHTVVPKV